MIDDTTHLVEILFCMYFNKKKVITTSENNNLSQINMYATKFIDENVRIKVIFNFLHLIVKNLF